MSALHDLVVTGGEIYFRGKLERMDLGLRAGKIVAIGSLQKGSGREQINASGLVVFPGFIDSQVHFREPGWEYKEDLESGSRAALLGGVTTFFEMPNTRPPTTGPEELEDKLNRAAGRCWTNYGFFIGATRENLSQLSEFEKLPGCVGIKVFVGSSTGSLLLDRNEDIEAVIRQGTRRIAFHCEDQARLHERKHLIQPGDGPDKHPLWRDEIAALNATQKVAELALKYRRPVHILHVSSAAEARYLSEVRSRKEAWQGGQCLVTCEVTPNHLLFEAPDCYLAKGTLVQMNPPIRAARHRLALWEALRSGVFDVIGSDHAPHSLVEKSSPYPETPSGMPGVQTMVPLMLDQFSKGELSLAQIVTLLSEKPAQIYGETNKGKIELGCDADLAFVDLGLKKEIRKDWLASRCGWSPYEGISVTGWPRGSVVNGRLAMWDSHPVGEPSGVPCLFEPS